MALTNRRWLNGALIAVILSGCTSSANSGIEAYRLEQKRSDESVRGYESWYNKPNTYIRLEFGNKYITKTAMKVIWHQAGQLIPFQAVVVMTDRNRDSGTTIPAGTAFELSRWEDGALYVRFEHLDQDYPLELVGPKGYAETSIVGLHPVNKTADSSR